MYGKTLASSSVCRFLFCHVFPVETDTFSSEHPVNPMVMLLIMNSVYILFIIGFILDIEGA